jgi:hypothetical protein
VITGAVLPPVANQVQSANRVALGRQFAQLRRIAALLLGCGGSSPSSRLALLASDRISSVDRPDWR